MVKYVNFSNLIGKILLKIVQTEDSIKFICDDGAVYKLYHSQNCCEHVYIEDICGDINSLIGQPILLAEESSNFENPLDESDESFTWTFYKLSTINGHVTIRWYGTSNGYYSESVDFVEL